MPKLFPYQVVGAEWLAGRERGGLHDEMGLGKTASAVRALDHIKARRVLVVAPAVVRHNWAKEIREFSNRKMRVCVGHTFRDYQKWEQGKFDYLIISYEQAANWSSHLMKHGEILDAVIYDESHFLKNSEAKRTQSLLGLSLDGSDAVTSLAKRAWMLTGTPMPKDPIDIYPFLRFTRAITLSKGEFERRYFTTRGLNFSQKLTLRPQMQNELRTLIEENALRRTAEDVGLQLPPVFLPRYLIDGDTKPVLDLLAEHPDLENAIIKAVEQGSLRFLDARHVATLRRLIGEAKAVPYSRLLHNEAVVGEHQKRVVFGIHINALRTVYNYLRSKGVGAVLVQGDTPEKQRVQAVESFQNDPDCIFFIGNIRAAGTGLTLTAAHHVDIFESAWTPADNAQAVFRVRRIGQTASRVFGRFITLAESLDERVNEVVARRTLEILKIQRGELHAAPV